MFGYIKLCIVYQTTIDCTSVYQIITSIIWSDLTLIFKDTFSRPKKAVVMSSIFASFPKPAYFNNFSIISVNADSRTSFPLMTAQIQTVVAFFANFSFCVVPQESHLNMEDPCSAFGIRLLQLLFWH